MAIMSNPASVSPLPRASLPADPLFGVMDRLADHLAPLFITDPDDLPTGRLIAGRTIASHQPEAQADFINIARTIAFSMSALAVLSRTAANDMAPELQLRYLGRAMALSRCADQSERTMQRRRRYQRTDAPPMPSASMMADFADPGTAPAQAQPDADVRDAETSGSAMTDLDMTGSGTAGPEVSHLQQIDPRNQDAVIEAAVAEAMLAFNSSRKQAAPAAAPAASPPRQADLSGMPKPSHAPPPQGIPARHPASMPPVAAMPPGIRPQDPASMHQAGQLSEAPNNATRSSPARRHM